MTTKIQTAVGTIRTSTQRRFVAVAEQAHDVFVAHHVTAGGSWVRMAAAHSEAEVAEKASAEMRRRGFEGRVEVSVTKAHAVVVKRSDSVEVARKAAAGRGFVFDTVTGERV